MLSAKHSTAVIRRRALKPAIFDDIEGRVATKETAGSQPGHRRFRNRLRRRPSTHTRTRSTRALPLVLALALHSRAPRNDRYPNQPLPSRSGQVVDHPSVPAIHPYAGTPLQTKSLSLPLPSVPSRYGRCSPTNRTKIPSTRTDVGRRSASEARRSASMVSSPRVKLVTLLSFNWDCRNRGKSPGEFGPKVGLRIPKNSKF
jgi:hypothetical protein